MRDMATQSPTYLLLEARLPTRSLKQHVHTRRRSGQSWSTIARDLHTTTGIAVTSETLRLWFPSATKGAPAKSPKVS